MKGPPSSQVLTVELTSHETSPRFQFIGDGRGSRALADGLTVSERRRDELKAEVERLGRGREAVSSRLKVVILQELLEGRTDRSALLLRALLEKIRLEPVIRGDREAVLPIRTTARSRGDRRRDSIDVIKDRAFFAENEVRL